MGHDRAVVLYAWEKDEEAIGDLRRALKLDPTSRSVCWLLSEVLHKTGEREEAEKYWKIYLAICNLPKLDTTKETMQ